MHRSASPRPGFRPSSRSGSLANSTPLSPRIGIRDRDRSRDSSPALHFLARRGSEANRQSDDENDIDAQDPFVVVDADEAMANAERDLKADAEWKRIQQNTFTRWANEHLKQADKQISNLESELSDGLKLISLIEVLSGKRMPKHNKKPNFRSQKLENVSIALQFLEREGVTLVNIDSTDIVDCKLKLILGLIWTLILHYAISMPMWDGPPLGGSQEDKTPKQRLLGWVKDKLPGELPVNNFTSDWNNGKAVGALVDSVAPGLCPDWEDWDPKRPLENAREAMDLADQWLNVPKLLTPEEIVNPNVDEQSMMTYLSQFPNAKLKAGAPLRQKTNPSKVRAYGPGLEPKGLVAKAPAKFTIETFGAGDGEVTVDVVGPGNKVVKCDIIFNNDRKHTYSCSYFPEEEGDYVVTIRFATREIPKSPYNVNVEGFAGDASKVTAAGPGLEPEGVVINRPTYFDIFCEGAGKGNAEVIILDPKGKKDSAPIKITPSNEKKDTYRCEYVATMLGLHSVNVFYAGNPIPDSPFGVKVAPISQPNKVWASGRGLQPNGIRINETVDFKVYTEGAGEGAVGVKIIGPGGKDVHATSRKVDDFVTEYTYTPQKVGRHIVMVTFANQEIPRSPFEVNIGAFKTSKIKAYGPGLKGGIINKPAVFTVDTCGETGSLGFSIEGPSQAKISCKDNGDGSADVDYLPTAIGEYAVHILCDKEDIPGSPYMAQILPATDFYPDKVKVFGPGVENGVNPKETTYFTVDITEAGDAPLEILIIDDLGQFVPDIKKKSEGVFDCSYLVRKGMHKQTIMVNFGGVAVPGSPFHVTNNNPNNPSKVEVYGPGVEPGVRAGVPVDFTVDCKTSGPGDIKVKIESSKRKSVPVSIENNGDDTYTVTYEAKDHGPQTITITLDDEEVPQSPIKLDIKKGVDLSQIKILDMEPRAFVDCVNDFYIDLSPLAPADQKATIQCDIKGPDGTPIDTYLSKVGPNGLHQVSYTPTDEGEHEIDVKYDGTSLPDTPYPVNAERGCDPSKVKISGDGLDKGIVDEVNTFVVETKNAGSGELGIAVEGPSEAEITCHDNKDGTCTVDYIPTEEGDYDVNVKFGDEHIPGSPFKVPVVTKDGKPKADARKVVAYGPGLEPGQVLPGKPAAFTVDSTATGEAPVEVAVTADGKNVSRKPTVVKKGDGIHEVTYVPPPVGDPYDISVKYGGQDIPGSPFAMTSDPNLDDVGYEKNGTGLQKKKLSSSSGRGGGDDKENKHGVRDLIRQAAPGAVGAAARKSSQDALAAAAADGNNNGRGDSSRKGSKLGAGRGLGRTGEHSDDDGHGSGSDDGSSPYGRNKDGSGKKGNGDADGAGGKDGRGNDKQGRSGKKPGHGRGGGSDDESGAGRSGDSSDSDGNGSKNKKPGHGVGANDGKLGSGKDGKKSSLFGGKGSNDNSDDNDNSGRRGSKDSHSPSRAGSKDDKYGKPYQRGDSRSKLGRGGSGDDGSNDGRGKGSSGSGSDGAGSGDRNKGPLSGQSGRPSFDDDSKYGRGKDSSGKRGIGNDENEKYPTGGNGKGTRQGDGDGKYGGGRPGDNEDKFGRKPSQGSDGDSDEKGPGSGRDASGRKPLFGKDPQSKYGKGREGDDADKYGRKPSSGSDGDKDGKGQAYGRDGTGRGPSSGRDPNEKYGKGKDGDDAGKYGRKPSYGSDDDNNGKGPGIGRDGAGRGPSYGVEPKDKDGKGGEGKDAEKYGRKPSYGSDGDNDGKGPGYGKDGAGRGPSSGRDPINKYDTGKDGDGSGKYGRKPSYGSDDDNDGKGPSIGRDGAGRGPSSGRYPNEKYGKGKDGDDAGKYGRKPSYGSDDDNDGKGPGIGRDGAGRGPSSGRDPKEKYGKGKDGDDAGKYGRKPSFGSDGDSDGKAPGNGRDASGRRPLFEKDPNGKYGKERDGNDADKYGRKPSSGSDGDRDGKGPGYGRDGTGRGPSSGRNPEDKYGKGRDGDDANKFGRKPSYGSDGDSDGKGPGYGRDGAGRGTSYGVEPTDKYGKGGHTGEADKYGRKPSYGSDGDNDGKGPGYGRDGHGLPYGLEPEDKYGKGHDGRGDGGYTDGQGKGPHSGDGKYGKGPSYGRGDDGHGKGPKGYGRPSSEDGGSSDDDKNRRGSKSGHRGPLSGRGSLAGVDGQNKRPSFGSDGSDGESKNSPKYGQTGQRKGPSFDADRDDGKYGKGQDGTGKGPLSGKYGKGDDKGRKGSRLGSGSQDGSSSDDNADKSAYPSRHGDGRGGNNKDSSGNRRGPSFGRGGDNENDNNNRGMDGNGNKKGYPYKRGDSNSSLLGKTTLDDPDEKYGRAKDSDRRGPLFRRGDSNSLYGDDNDIDGSPYGRKDNLGRDGPLSGGKVPLYGRHPGDDSGAGRKGSHPYDDQDGRKGQGPKSGSGRRGSDGGPFKPLDLNGIPLPPGAAGRIGDRVEAIVKTPNGNNEKAIVSDNGNGSLGVSYQPTEAGPHNLDIKYNGDHVQGSPYKFHATPLDEGKVAAYGPGLTHGVCGDPSKFVISTKGAGAGGLSLAVEGPSKAEINCQDNKDGTVDVSYLPTAPGEYKISAKFADKHIEGSPFTCKITGEGTKRNAISVGSSSELSLPENLSDYDLRSLQAYIVSPSGAEEPCFLKKLPKGNNGISFTPREIGEHQVSVKRNGKHIKNSPFKINVNPDDVGDASRVKVDGGALGEGKTHKDNVFTVDTKNAGYGGLSLSVEGPSKAEIKCTDNEDGTLDVSYKPTEPGLYIVNLKFADQHVPGSPFAVAVSGEGSEKQTGKIKRMREAVPITEVGSQCRLTFKMPGVNCTDLKANVTSPTGKVEKALVAEIEDGLYSVNFVPYELGIHTVSVMYRDVDIPGSPFQFTVGPLQDGGAHRVHAGGPGLERGIQGQPADFNVWTREAGHGSLAISVEGPSKAEVDFKDRKDGSCHVSYIVEEPGEYSVGIRFNDTHIPGSPYKVYIQPSADEAERVRLSNVADCPVSPDVPQTMLLNMNGADGDVECKIIAPSGREDDCFITPLGEGEHSVRFVPKEEGTHFLHAKLNGIHIPGSPFKLVVGGNRSGSIHDDPSTVGVSGLGIERGTTGEPSTFVIDTSGVGAGTLSITVDGPSKVDLSCNEVDEGYQVRYTPMVPGKYFVTVKYNGKNVKGSPFSVNIGGDNLSGGNSSLRNLQSKEESRSSSMTMETMQRTSYIRHQYSEQRASSVSVSRSSTRPIIPTLVSDASLVTCRGSGLESAAINRRNSFNIDCGKAGNNCLFVGVFGPEVPCEEVLIKHRGGHRYSVEYVVKEKGDYIIFVKWGDDHVPGSPFHIRA